MKKVYYNDNTVGLVNLTSEGGIPYVAGTGIDITNDVISVTGMTAESAFTAYTSSTATEIGNKADTTAMTQAISEATSGKVDASTYTAYTAATDTAIGNKADTTAVTQSINEATSGKADTTAVTADISAAVSGKVDTTTYTAYTAATDSVLAGKQEALSAGTGIDITDNVISVTGGGGGGDCTVEETVVYNRIKSRYEDLNGDNKVTYVIIDYLSDKSSADNVSIFFTVGDTNNGQTGYIHFDYVNHSANTAPLSDYVTAEYITDIQDFKVSLKSAYQSTWWFKNIQDLGYSKNVLIPFYTISSGSPCTVISTDVVGLVNKVKDITYKSIGNLQISSDKSKIIVTSYVNDGTQGTTYITLEDLDGTNGILKPNINIPLGTSGWTAIDIGDMSICSANKPGEIGATVYRITYSYDEQNIDYSNLTTSFEILLNKLGSQWYNDSQYIDFVESGSTYVPSIRSQIFDGLEPTLDWDATTKKLIVSYPATYTHPNDIYGIGTYDVVVNSIRSSACRMGSLDLLSGIEYYAEQIQPLKPFVQQLRTDVNTISGEVQSKVSTSAVTTAVTSGSTDAEIPTAKAVYDAIPQGGGGKAIEAGRGISITTGETADTVSFNLPISAGTGTSGTYIAIGVNAYAQEGYKSFLSNAGGISIGSGSSANRNSIIIGNGAADDKDRGHGISIGTGAKSKYGSISIGEFSESSGTAYEEESSIAIGYGTTAKNVIKALAIGTDVRTTGTTKTNINNQLTIDTSNQVYIYNKDNTEMICLQDHLGGGGSSYSAGTGIDITNNVISVTGMVATSSIVTAVTSSSTDSEIPSAKAVYDAIQEGGGGKAIEAGRGISITTGETADTVSFNLPIYSGTGEGSIIGGFSGNTASGKYSIALGGRYENKYDYQYCKASGKGAISFGGTASGQGAFSCGENPQALGTYSVAFGNATKAMGIESFVIGRKTSANTFASFAQGMNTKTTNEVEVALGEYNNSVSGSSTFGDSGNTLFSVGNGTSNSARHNAFEIRQNGDIYFNDGTNDVKLQDKFTSIETTIGDINTILQSI